MYRTVQYIISLITALLRDVSVHAADEVAWANSMSSEDNIVAMGGTVIKQYYGSLRS